MFEIINAILLSDEQDLAQRSKKRKVDESEMQTNNLLDGMVDDNVLLWKKLYCNELFGSLGFMRDYLFKNNLIARDGNKYRDRSQIVSKISDLSDQEFKRMYRLDRIDFTNLLKDISEELSNPSPFNTTKNPIPATAKLCATLRWLAGGSYLDIAFGYNISVKTVHSMFYEVITAIDDCVQNINFPIDDEVKLRELETGFNKISKNFFKGTVAAGDGVVFKMFQPTSEACNGDVISFFTRKGYYAYGMQAFADSACRFVSISMKTCSSTHDSTAYLLSDLSDAIKGGRLPSWAHVVLDEAYPCKGQEISPYKGRALDEYQDSFNYHLSLHRQVIERAFGLLVARWGIFWRPLRVDFDKIPVIIRVCCKLHNICIDRFGLANPEVTRKDQRPGDVADVSLTDGTGMTRGSRTDLARSDHRQALMAHLKMMKKVRPPHSKWRKYKPSAPDTLSTTPLESLRTMRI